jgi:hypothetical protein
VEKERKKKKREKEERKYEEKRRKADMKILRKTGSETEIIRKEKEE